MTYLFDRDYIQKILYASSYILSEYFFYDEEGLNKFQSFFATAINQQHSVLLQIGTDEFKKKMADDKETRLDYTGYIAGYHIARSLHKEMNFNDKELEFFHDILFKHIGAKNE